MSAGKGPAASASPKGATLVTAAKGIKQTTTAATPNPKVSLPQRSCRPGSGGRPARMRQWRCGPTAGGSPRRPPARSAGRGCLPDRGAQGGRGMVGRRQRAQMQYANIMITGSKAVDSYNSLLSWMTAWSNSECTLKPGGYTISARGRRRSERVERGEPSFEATGEGGGNGDASCRRAKASL